MGLSGLEQLKTVRVDLDPSGVATVRLDRPATGNAVDRAVCDDFRRVWSGLRDDDAVRVIVLLAEGDDFCTGIDLDDFVVRDDDPGAALGPKRNRVWKPLICAVQGRVEGPAFHWLNGSDIVIAAENASFYEGALNHGFLSAVVPIGLAERLPIGEVMRLVLMGLDEGMSAERAHQLGLVSEVVARPALVERAHHLATRIAVKSPTAVQGTVRAIWESQQMAPWVAQAIGGHYVNLGNDRSMNEVDPALFESGHRPKWELR